MPTTRNAWIAETARVLLAGALTNPDLALFGATEAIGSARELANALEAERLAPWQPDTTATESRRAALRDALDALDTVLGHADTVTACREAVLKLLEKEVLEDV